MAMIRVIVLALCIAYAAAATAAPDLGGLGFSGRDVIQGLISLVFALTAAYAMGVIRRVDKHEKSIEDLRIETTQITRMLLSEYQKRTETMLHFDKIEKSLAIMAEKQERSMSLANNRLDQLLQRP